MNIAAWIVLSIIGLLVFVYVIVAAIIWFWSPHMPPEMLLYEKRAEQKKWALTWPFHFNWHGIRMRFSENYRKQERRK